MTTMTAVAAEPLPRPDKPLWKVLLKFALVLAAAYAILEIRRPSALHWTRMTPAALLWVIFFVYWSIAGRNSAASKKSEAKSSTMLHQLLLNVAMVLLFWAPAGWNAWFVSETARWPVIVGPAVQALFMVLAIWARIHLGHNWSAAVRIGVGHQLVRSGPYRMLRHPIYTAMLGMFTGTAIASGRWHAIAGVALLFAAYIRKTRLEEDALRETFGAEYEAYKRGTWRLIPPF